MDMRDLRELRSLQYEYNRRRSQMMEADYKQGLAVPTIRWVITEGDLRKHKMEKELQNVYRDAYLAWDNYYRDNDISGQDYERFGTSPVRDAYWGIVPNPGPYVWKSNIKKRKPCVKTTQITPPEILEHFDPKLLSTPVPTMVFRRFDNLMPPEEELDILVKALLGFPQPMGYKYGSNNVILNDAWTVNLRTTEKENVLMDAFLNGFGQQFSELKKQWEETQKGHGMVGIDVEDELKDLLKVYTDAEEHLKRKEADALSTLSGYMKRFLDIQEERKKVTDKLQTLKAKMTHACEGCDEDEEEDEE